MRQQPLKDVKVRRGTVSWIPRFSPPFRFFDGSMITYLRSHYDIFKSVATANC